MRQIHHGHAPRTRNPADPALPSQPCDLATIGTPSLLPLGQAAPATRKGTHLFGFGGGVGPPKRQRAVLLI